METLEESIAVSMDRINHEVIEFLPYILQDFWELGTSADLVAGLIRKHKNNYQNIHVLDLGSGKGAVSVKLASELRCRCLGIDGISGFTDYANQKAKEYHVDDLCTFETGDIRTKIEPLGQYDVIVLGATGPIFGNYFDTLSGLSKHLAADGLIIIDDGYTDDNGGTSYPWAFHKSELLKQIHDAGMELADEIINDDTEDIEDQYNTELDNINKRCQELVEKYPEKKHIFLEYRDRQKEEYGLLGSEVICSVMVIKKKQ